MEKSTSATGAKSTVDKAAMSTGSKTLRSKVYCSIHNCWWLCWQHHAAVNDTTVPLPHNSMWLPSFGGGGVVSSPNSVSATEVSLDKKAACISRSGTST